SVIIPYHKGISFLEDCLQSLVEQSYKDMEVILVCDHVEEDVDTLIEPYKTLQTIKLLELKDKTGVAAARNLGLSAATGEYIYFLDSDDYIGNKTLELLVTAAEVNQGDLAYGKKIWTWFKRSIFMENFSNEENENEDEDEDEENSSLDSAELNMENGGESESSSSLNEDQLLSDDSEEGEEADGKDTPKDPESKKKTALNHLVTSRKGVRNISVLNQLIRRSIIEENRIRFNEDIKFLSDYPFLLQILTHADKYEYQPLAVYMKRNHNDSVNMPALSQMRGSKSFKEYVDTYRYAISLLDADNNLRIRLDKKIIQYCVRYFAPNLRRSKKAADREVKFGIMHQLISNMNLELLKSKKRYKRKLLKAFYIGDINKAKTIVNRHLAWKKFKRITKNKRAFSKFLYIHFFLKRPMKQNWVFCESFFGKNYSDSPKYVYEYVSKNYPGQFKFIWVIDKKKTKIPYKHTKVKRFSFRYAYYLARSKYYVFNGRQPEWARKRKGNVFLQTWHGTPLKRLVFDMEDISSATPRYKHQVYKQSRAWDYLIAPNKYSSDIFRRCFMYDKEMLETGYPRNDILHDENRDQITQNIREKLGIPKDKKTILYAPTWRDDEYYTKGRYKFSLKLDLQLLKEKLGKEYVILLRTHYFIAASLDVTGLEDFAFNFSKYDDISELYLISDILITDYSSVFFDYANLKRPMLFFTYDLEKYRDILRGFYIDIEEELPGPLLFTTEEIITAVNDIDKLQKEYQQKYVAFYDKYCSWEDGNASRKVANAVFGLKGDLNETEY
ncbi:MAG: bifunctional glycosyltransferase family 2 protein/CDP-glycerol:glycerophosphate glycerophosphotransferase, partial [Herbinix sp.]|nr:bifunctional glycosyltransferase family 2 protein/CDP-glycerol:glycerophosphate glycerophosphotransferase [Herbinix sp.]